MKYHKIAQGYPSFNSFPIFDQKIWGLHGVVKPLNLKASQPTPLPVEMCINRAIYNSYGIIFISKPQPHTVKREISARIRLQFSADGMVLYRGSRTPRIMANKCAQGYRRLAAICAGDYCEKFKNWFSSGEMPQHKRISPHIGIDFFYVNINKIWTAFDGATIHSLRVLGWVNIFRAASPLSTSVCIKVSFWPPQPRLISSPVVVSWSNKAVSKYFISRRRGWARTWMWMWMRMRMERTGPGQISKQ